MQQISASTIESLSKISRRQVMGMLGLGLLASQFPFACSADTKLTEEEKKSIHYRTLSEVSELIKAGKISSEELTKLMLQRIAAIDSKLNSYITVMGEDALKTARAMDKELAEGKYRGPLHGVSVGIKDLLYTTNAPTTASHAFKKEFIAPYNATVVERLNNAGAVILGKLNLTEGAMGGYPPAWPVPHNPWGADLYTGMSSSGSGVATAAGLCFASIGSDTGGSIRFPSAANGVVGLKPTYGLVSRYGVMPLAPTLDHVGPMARSTMDAAIMLEAIAGNDSNDPTSLSDKSINITNTIKESIKGLRIGYDSAYASKGVAPSIVGAIESALRKLEELGATIVPVKMVATVIEDAWFTICTREAAEANRETFPSRKSEYGRYFSELLEMGTRVTDDQYQSALKVKEAFSTEFRELLAGVDSIVAPAGGVVKGVNDELWRAGMQDGVVAKFLEDLDLEFGAPADFAGIPSLTLPCGKAENGFPPPGMQLMSGPLKEAVLCRIGYAYEQATGWNNQHPNL